MKDGAGDIFDAALALCTNALKACRQSVSYAFSGLENDREKALEAIRNTRDAVDDLIQAVMG